MVEPTTGVPKPRARSKQIALKVGWTIFGIGLVGGIVIWLVVGSSVAAPWVAATSQLRLSAALTVALAGLIVVLLAYRFPAIVARMRRTRVWVLARWFWVARYRTMRRLRISLRQLLLLVALCAMVAGYCRAVSLSQRQLVKRITHVQFSPDGHQLAVAQASGLVQVWDCAGAQPRIAAETTLGIERYDRMWYLPPIRWANRNTIAYVAASDDPTGAQMKQWDPATGQHSDLVRVPGPTTGYCGFNVQNNSIVFAWPNSGCLCLIDLISKKKKFLWASSPIDCVLAVSADGKYAAVRHATGFEVVELPRGRSVITDTDEVDAATFTGAANLVLYRAQQKAPGQRCAFVRARDISNGEMKWESEVVPAHSTWGRGAGVDSVHVLPGGDQLAVVHDEGIVFLDVPTGRHVKTVDLDMVERSAHKFLLKRPWLVEMSSTHGHWPTHSARDALSNDGRLYARATQWRPLWLWDTSSGTRHLLPSMLNRCRQPAAFVIGFIVWGVVWGLLRRVVRCKGMLPASIVMFASGVGLVFRGVGIGFFHPILCIATLPYLGIGLYSISRSMACNRRTILRVAAIQFVGVLFSDLWLCISVVFMLSFLPPSTDRNRAQTSRIATQG
jgi:hypothetical protein